MNTLEELRIHVEALVNVVEQDTKFFSSILYYVRRLRDILKESNKNLTQKEIKLLADKIEEFYAQWRPIGDGFYIPPAQTSNSDKTVIQINGLVKEICSLDESSFSSLFSTIAVKSNIAKTTIVKRKNIIFIGHGRSKLWARLEVFLKNELGLQTITYETNTHVGESIVPTLEKFLEIASFAVLVLTAEDTTSDGLQRARQNVIHEAGLFQGKLGFKKAIILKQEGIEEFSNIAGLQYIGFSKENIEQCFYELQRVLKREEIIK